MPSTREIRRRIKSVKNTGQITKAMQMVAASKMRRAQTAALSGRPYAQLMNQMLGDVVARAGDFSHPLMEEREVRRRAVVVVSTDKGLCGALNTNLLREASRYDAESTTFIAAGRKAAQFVARTRRDLSADFSYKDAPDFGEARAISRYAQELFLNGTVDAVEVLYTNFISTLTQKPSTHALLPLRRITGLEAGVEGEDSTSELHESAVEYQFEPDPANLFGALLPHYLNFQMYQFLLEAKASEHSARMVAMKSATDNAKQMVKDLTLEYNKIRQASITSELLEISSAAAAMSA